MCIRDRPVAAQGVGQGHGHGGGGGRTKGEGHRVQAGHGADPVGEPALDDDRHQHIADGDAHEGECAGGQETGRAPGVRPYQQAPGDGGHAGAHHGTRSEAAGQAGRGDAEDGEAERGHGGQQPGHTAAHAEPVADLLQERAEAGDGGAEVQRGQHDGNDDQTCRPRARGRRLTRARRRGRNPFGRLPRRRLLGRRRLGTGLRGPCFFTSHAAHHRIMG